MMADADTRTNTAPNADADADARDMARLEQIRDEKAELQRRIEKRETKNQKSMDPWEQADLTKQIEELRKDEKGLAAERIDVERRSLDRLIQPATNERPQPIRLRDKKTAAGSAVTDDPTHKSKKIKI